VTLAELAERTVSNERLISQLTGTFGVVAVLVACLGLYGTVSYSVVRRTSEIGVRLALGATPSQVRWLVLRETLVLVAAGSVSGVILVAAAMRLAATLLYGLSPYDPATLAAATLALATMGLLASLLPAWRASRVEPTAALRAE
jgi:ABC-type antimicrobial peptide transport system permease subunit